MSGPPAKAPAGRPQSPPATRPKPPQRPADPHPAAPAAKADRNAPHPVLSDGLPPSPFEPDGLPPFHQETASSSNDASAPSGGQPPAARAKKPAPRTGKKPIYAADLLAAIEPPHVEAEPEAEPEPEPEPKAKFEFQLPKIELSGKNKALYGAGAAVIAIGLTIAIVSMKMQARARAISPQALAKIPVMDPINIPVLEAPPTVDGADGKPAGPATDEPADEAPQPVNLPAASAALPAGTAVTASKATDPGAKFTTEEIVSRCENSVAMVKGRRGSGSGFIVRPGVLITNKHVVAQELMPSLQIFFPSCPEAERGPFGASLIYEDQALDIAVLKTAAPQPPLSIAANYQFRRGHEVTVIGNPGAFDGLILQNAVSRGIMSTEATIEGLPYYQLGIAINPGNSGGPVFDDHADVIGIVTLKAANKESIGFCIPLYKLREVLDRVDHLSEKQINLTDSRHRARVVFVGARSVGHVYKEVASIYAAQMDTVLERDKITKRVAGASRNKRGAAAGQQDPGRSLSLQVDPEVEEKIRKMLGKYDEAMLGDLRSEVNLVIADANLGDEERKKFREYWANYTEFKQVAEDARSRKDFEAYLKKFGELEKQRKSVGEWLQKTLGVASADEER